MLILHTNMVNNKITTEQTLSASQLYTIHKEKGLVDNPSTQSTPLLSLDFSSLLVLCLGVGVWNHPRWMGCINITAILKRPTQTCMHNVKLINSNYLMLRTALIINGLKFVASITIMSKHQYCNSGQANLISNRTSKPWDNWFQKLGFPNQIRLYKVSIKKIIMSLSWEGNWGKYCWIVEQVL